MLLLSALTEYIFFFPLASVFRRTCCTSGRWCDSLLTDLKRAGRLENFSTRDVSIHLSRCTWRQGSVVCEKARPPTTSGTLAGVSRRISRGHAKRVTCHANFPVRCGGGRPLSGKLPRSSVGNRREGFVCVRAARWTTTSRRYATRKTKGCARDALPIHRRLKARAIDFFLFFGVNRAVIGKSLFCLSRYDCATDPSSIIDVSFSGFSSALRLHNDADIARERDDIRLLLKCKTKRNIVTQYAPPLVDSPTSDLNAARLNFARSRLFDGAAGFNRHGYIHPRR